jgi:hypothetical protein
MHVLAPGAGRDLLMFIRISETEAAYASARGTSYRLLASPGTPGAWMIIPDVSPAEPTFYAVPQADAYGFEIRRGADGEVIGYGMNLSDIARPVEMDLIFRGVA